MADPGFPVGGAPTRWGGTNLRCVHFSVKTYAKTKEIDPVGGARRRRPPGSANEGISDLGIHARQYSIGLIDLLIFQQLLHLVMAVLQ